MSHWETKQIGLEHTLLMLQRSGGASISELRYELGCHQSTVYEYIKTIRERYEVKKLATGNFWLNPNQIISNVALHPYEALTIYLALRRFVSQTNRAPQFMIRAMQKVIPALRRPDLIDNLQHANLQLQERNMATEDDEKLWRILLDSWLNNIVLRIDYLKPNAQREDQHLVEPYLFEPMPWGDGTYLIAWSRTRNALRTFKLERIQRANLTMDNFEPGRISIEDLIRHAWGIWYGEDTKRIVLRFAPEKARRVMESAYHFSETKTLQADGSLIWTVEVATTRELQHWILGWGAGVEVLEPASLRREIAQELRHAAALYQSGKGEADRI